jgi:hypothetical protein
MDTRKFDELTVQLASGLNRRQLFKGIFGGALGLTTAGSLQRATMAQECAGIQESCAELDCCDGYGCDENDICIAIAECADIQEGCLTHEQCCEGLFCGETGICIAAAECVSEGGGCEIDENCCDDRVCGEEGVCVDGISAGTTLPNTGINPGGQGSGWMMASVAAIGSAALAAGAFLRRDGSPDTR